MMDVRWRDKAGWIGAALAAGGVLFFAGRLSSPAPADAPLSIEPVASVPEGASSQELKVHVVGLVAKPGLYSMPVGSRVQDAIDKAGGPLKEADLEMLNLAQKLEDGVQLRVAAKGNEPVKIEGLPEGSFGLVGPMSTVPAPSGRTAPSTRSSSSSSKAAKPAARSISLNTATASELDRLPGVGPATAAKILEYRREHGGFSSVDELLAVRGIGPKKLADIKPFVRL